MIVTWQKDDIDDSEMSQRRQKFSPPNLGKDFYKKVSQSMDNVHSRGGVTPCPYFFGNFVSKILWLYFN